MAPTVAANMKAPTCAPSGLSATASWASSSPSSSNGFNIGAREWRLSGKLGGGPPMEMGVYSLNACRYPTGKEPVEVKAARHPPRRPLTRLAVFRRPKIPAVML
jgi:predicted dehydrogenase